jgi:hypothetical protein
MFKIYNIFNPTVPDPTPELRWLGDHHCGGPWQQEGWASPHPGVNVINHSLVSYASAVPSEPDQPRYTSEAGNLGSLDVLLRFSRNLYNKTNYA